VPKSTISAANIGLNVGATVTRKTRNFVIAYILLVGLPVAGLLVVLKHGRKLTAPVSVDGNWQLQGNLADLAALACGTPLPAPEDAVLSISQSGKNLVVNLPNGFRTETSGLIDGTTLSATLTPAVQRHAAGCGKDHSVTLIASLNLSARPRTLAGTIGIDECPSCSPVNFVAVRQAPAGKKGAH